MIFKYKIFNFFLFIYLFKSSFNFFHPNISIIVPIYNVKKYLNQCLNSLINQTLKNIEIICVNDGSTDNSFEILMKYKNDKKVIILNKTNSGYGDSMNQGIEYTSGQYIGIIEPDDFADIHMFENLYNYTKNNSIDIVRSNYYFYWRRKKIKGNKFRVVRKLYNKIFNPIAYPKIFYIIPSIWAGIYKKNLIIENNIKFLTTPGASFQDISFFFKTMFKARKVFFSKKRFLYYRVSNSNSSIKNNSFIKTLYVHKEFDSIENFIKKDITAFKKIEKYFNTVKILNYLWNLRRVKNKKRYMKYFYRDTFKILQNNNYIHRRLTNFENKFFSYLKNHGEEAAFEYFLYRKNHKTNPKISIIIPVYNSEKVIEECLNSLLVQTFKDFEIICVNDGSTDNTLNILKNIKKKDKRINIINQNNTGAGISRNEGMKKAKGEYLIFLDSDDIFEKTMLENLYNKIIEKDVDIVICNSITFKTQNKRKIFSKRKNYLISNKRIKNKNNPFSSFDIKKDFFNLFIWWPWDKLYKKKYIKNLGIKFQNLRSTNDLYFVASSVIASKKILFLDKILIYHRVGVKSSISNSREKSWDNFYYALKELKHFLIKKGLYKRFKRDFINYVATFSLWHLETIKGKSFCFLYEKLKNEWYKEFELTKQKKKYFYSKKIYKKIKNILKSDFKTGENINKNNYLKLKKRLCFPKISIIIPVFNSEKYLNDSLNSIKNQTLKDIEIICINDGSFDNSLKILNNFKLLDNRIIIIHQKKKGINYSRNSGLKIAKGEFILFFEYDALLKPEALEEFYKISINNSLDILYFNVNLIFEENLTEKNNYPFNIYYSIENSTIIFNNKNLFLKLTEKNKYIMSPCFQFIKHSLLLKNKINFFEEIFYDDYLFNFKLMNSFNISAETNQTFYIKKIDKNFINKNEILIKKLHDYIINIRLLLIESLKYEKEITIQNSLELFTNNLEEIIFLIFKKININEFFLLNHWEQKDKILLLSILENKNKTLHFVYEMFKKDNKSFYIKFLFNKFEKKNCYKISYKLEEIKNILLIENKFNIIKNSTKK